MTAELADRAVTLGRLLHAAGGSATVAELRERAGGMSTGTAAKALSELADVGLVERVGGAKGTPRLTADGLVRFAGVEPVSAGQVVDAATAVWPYTHAAFLRLYLAAAVARRHLAGARPHIGFVVVGEPRTGKSALFAQACHLLGLDPDTHTRDLALMTAGEVLGRREGGTAATFVPAAYLARPVVLLDEFDKATPALRDHAAKVLLQGRYRTVVENQDLTVACTPMLAANVPTDTADRFAHLHVAYRTRRSVLLDAGVERDQLGDLGHRLEQYYASHPAGQLDLVKLVPPATQLPNGRELWDSLRGFLVEGGGQHFPNEQALDGLALGYAALCGVQPGDEAGLTLAAIFALVDWHACASTVPGVVDPAADLPQLELTEAHREYYGRSDLASLQAAIAEQHAGADRRKAEAVARRQQRIRVSDDVVRDRGELAEDLRLAREAIAGTKVTAEHKARAAGLREVLGKLRTSVQQTSRPDALQEARERAAQPLRDAHQLAQRVAGERTAAQRARADATAAERRSREDTKAAAKQQSEYQRQVRRQSVAQARAELAAVRELLRELERLYRRSRTAAGDNPLRELEQLRVVTYQPDPAATTSDQPKGWRRMFAGPDPWPGSWVAQDGTGFPGGPGGCPSLASWGEGTRAVLASVLRDGHAQEDQLVARLGVKPRANRPPVPARAQAVAASSRTVSALLPAAGARYGMRHR